MHEDDYMCPNCGAEIASYPNYCVRCEPERVKEYMQNDLQCDYRDLQIKVEKLRKALKKQRALVKKLKLGRGKKK